MKTLLFAAGLTLVAVDAPAYADNVSPPPGFFYHSIYMASGYLLRSTKVCIQRSEPDRKHTVDVAFGLISSPEFRMMSQGYPKLTDQWWGEGAGTFNDEVMNTGVARACAHAVNTQSKAEAALKRLEH
jgi:hypothetical protein